MLNIRGAAAALFCLASVASLSQCQPPSLSNQPAKTRPELALPDSPAGKQLTAFLEAFNSGRKEPLRQFFATNFQKPQAADDMAEQDAGLYKTLRGFVVRKIVKSSPQEITAVVQAKLTENWLQIRMHVAEQPPHRILEFGHAYVLAPPDLAPHQKLTEDEMRRKVDALMKKLAEADAFSGAILVAKDSKPIYENTFGMASRAWKIPARIDTKFNIASLAKMFTGVAVAQLVERGKLCYEDTLGKILPDYPNPDVAQKVTVHHLLTHTSGLGSKTLGSFRRGFRTIKEYFPSLAQEAPRFEPGTKFDYSNDGYLILGAIIEKASGQGYYDYIREHIYGPAGMTNSDSYELDTDPPNLATGYMDGPNGTRRNNVFTLPVKGLPYGLGYSTVGDLLKFAVALRNHKLLSAKSTAIVWEGKIDKRQGGQQYGYGFFVSRYNGIRAVGHGGGWAGVTNRMDMFPDLGYMYVVLSNYDAEVPAISFKLREWITQGHQSLGLNPRKSNATEHLKKLESPEEAKPSPLSLTPLQTSAKSTQVIARLEERLPQLMKEADVPGLSIALVRGGELVWHHGFGVKNSKSKEPVDDTTVFNAASLSKPVFAYAVLRLVDEGKFDLDKPLNQYLPGNYDVGDDARLGKLTARHVLSHTTGLPNWRGSDKLKIHFTPGERFSYSGEGFVYLAKVIEHVTGEKFNDFMKRTVFDPLGMASSSYVWRDDYDKLVTFRHNGIGEPGGQGKPPAGQANTGNAAGSLNTTARDYGRFVAAILNGTGLKPQTCKVMLTPQVQVREGGPNSIDRPQAKPVPDVAWGVGWGLQTTKDGLSFWHWGDNGDCKAFVVAFDQPKLAVVFFANSANGLSIAREIVAEAVGGAQPALDWLNYDRYDSPRRVLFKDIRARGAAAALRDYRAKRDEQPADALSEKQMNGLGYDLLRLKRSDDALEVFKLNVSLYPDSWNTYDSLAEAYEAAGDKASAVKNFKRSLELNPKNGNAVDHLKKLVPEQAPASPPKDGAQAKRDNK